MAVSKSLFVLFSGVAAVSAIVVPRTSPPAGWWTEGMEDYQAYHTRYLALGCQNQHGNEFFDLCCHPLKKDETLETARPPECVPAFSDVVSACLAEPTSTVTTPDEPATPPTTSAPEQSSAVSNSDSSASDATPSPVSNVATGTGDDNGSDNDEEDGFCDADDEDGDDGEEDDGEEDDGDEICEEDDGEDDSASVLPTSTLAQTPEPTPEPTSPPQESDSGDNADEDCESDGENEGSSASFAPTSVEPVPSESITLEPTSELITSEATSESTDEANTKEQVTPVPTSTSEPAEPETSSVESRSVVETSEAPAPISSDDTPVPTESLPDALSSFSESTPELTITEAPAAAEPTQALVASASGEVNAGGFATFFYQDNNAGACGTVHSDSDFIAAMDSRRYSTDLCGRKVKITNTNNGKVVTVTIADECPTCENQNSIDLSTGAFDQIADESEGLVPISWQFV